MRERGCPSASPRTEPPKCPRAGPGEVAGVAAGGLHPSHGAAEFWDQLAGCLGDFWERGCTPLSLGASDGNADAPSQRHFSWLKKQVSNTSLGQDGRTDRHQDSPC